MNKLLILLFAVSVFKICDVNAAQVDSDSVVNSRELAFMISNLASLGIVIGNLAFFHGLRQRRKRLGGHIRSAKTAQSKALRGLTGSLRDNKESSGSDPSGSVRDKGASGGAPSGPDASQLVPISQLVTDGSYEEVQVHGDQQEVSEGDLRGEQAADPVSEAMLKWLDDNCDPMKPQEPLFRWPGCWWMWGDPV